MCIAERKSWGVNCSLCKGNHRESECHVVTNIDERRELLKKQGRCFDCSMGDSSNNSAGAAASPTLHIGSGMHVFLQTAQVNVSIPWKELSHILTVRSIFDTGAERSYINQKVVNALK